MALQETFYIIGIICMGLYTILLLAVVIVLFYIWKRISDIQKKIEERLEDLKQIFRNPRQTAADMGAAAASNALNQFAEFIRPKKKKEE